MEHSLLLYEALHGRTALVDKGNGKALDARREELRREVEETDRNYLLNVSESQLCDHLVSKYALDAPNLRVGGILDRLAVGRSRLLVDMDGRVLKLLVRIVQRRCHAAGAC